MVRKTKVLVISGFLVSLATSAYGAMAVYDGTAIAKITEQISEMKKQVANQIEQINKMKEQISIFNDIKKLHTEVTDAIGAVSRIRLPITSLENIASQLRKDTACLFPKTPAYGIDFAELDTSLCNMTAIYGRNFFTNEKTLAKMSWSEQSEERARVAKNREAYTSDTVARAMAQGDLSQRTAEETGKIADQLQNSLDNAETLQDRLAVSAQIGIAQLRATAQQTQILAQMLKLQAGVALEFSVNPDTAPSEKLGSESNLSEVK